MKTKSTLLFLTIILVACSQTFATPETFYTQIPITLTTAKTPLHIAKTNETLTPSSSKTAVSAKPISTPTLMHLDHSIIDIPDVTPTFNEQCGGMYNSELFSLSALVDYAVKTLDAKAEGWAEGIGQDCSATDGKSYFHSFGIWFYIDKPVADLNDYESLGSWIVSVINLLDTIPRNEFSINADPTIVNFRFYTYTSERLDIQVPIKKYLTEANGKNNLDVFFLFYKTP